MVCLREANCKQLCYSGAAFYLDRPRGSQCRSTAQALGAHGCAKGRISPTSGFLQAGSWQQEEDKPGGLQRWIFTLLLPDLPACLFIPLVPQDVAVTSLSSA